MDRSLLKEPQGGPARPKKRKPFGVKYFFRWWNGGEAYYTKWYRTEGARQDALDALKRKNRSPFLTSHRTELVGAN